MNTSAALAQVSPSHDAARFELHLDSLDLRVAPVPAHRAAEADALLARTHIDDPVMQYILGDHLGYGKRLQQLMHLLTAGAWLGSHSLLGAFDSRNRLIGVALLKAPGNGAMSFELFQLTDQCWRTLGDEARARFETIEAALAGQSVDRASNWNLQLLGVERAWRSRGGEAALLRGSMLLAARRARGEQLEVTTTSQALLPVLENQGMAIVGRSTAAGQFPFWALCSMPMSPE